MPIHTKMIRCSGTSIDLKLNFGVIDEPQNFLFGQYVLKIFDVLLDHGTVSWCAQTSVADVVLCTLQGGFKRSAIGLGTVSLASSALSIMLGLIAPESCFWIRMTRL